MIWGLSVYFKIDHSLLHFLPKLKESKSITSIDLSKNNFNGIESLALCEFVLYFRRLKSIKLNNCNIKDDEFASIVTSLQNGSYLTTLDASFNRITV